jgi:hypothetical protein
MYKLTLLERARGTDGKELGSWVCAITPPPAEGAIQFMLDDALVPERAKNIGSVLSMTISYCPLGAL